MDTTIGAGPAELARPVTRSLRRRLRMELGRCEAATVETLARRLHVGEEQVRPELGQMLDAAEIEALTPIGTGVPGVGPYYRLRRRSDRDHVWEREVTIRLPLSRMGQLRGWEEPVRRAAATAWPAGASACGA